MANTDPQRFCSGYPSEQVLKKAGKYQAMTPYNSRTTDTPTMPGYLGAANDSWRFPSAVLRAPSNEGAFALGSSVASATMNAQAYYDALLPRAAMHDKGIFDRLNLRSYPKTSASRGLHVQVPMRSGPEPVKPSTSRSPASLVRPSRISMS